MMYYTTFGASHPYGKLYVRVRADTYEEARDAMFLAHGNKWAFLYDEDGWEGQVEKYGYKHLTTLTKNNYGNWSAEEPWATGI